LTVESDTAPLNIRPATAYRRAQVVKPGERSQERQCPSLDKPHSDDDNGTKKGKGFPYSIPSVGSGADPGVQAVSPQVTAVSQPTVTSLMHIIVYYPAVGCHYFPPGLQLPLQPQSITALWPVPSYTAW